MRLLEGQDLPQERLFNKIDEIKNIIAPVLVSPLGNWVSSSTVCKMTLSSYRYRRHLQPRYLYRWRDRACAPHCTVLCSVHPCTRGTMRRHVSSNGGGGGGDSRVLVDETVMDGVHEAEALLSKSEKKEADGDEASDAGALALLLLLYTLQGLPLGLAAALPFLLQSKGAGMAAQVRTCTDLTSCLDPCLDMLVCLLEPFKRPFRTVTLAWSLKHPRARL
eukprot:3112280-Pleurochrysis_carterae.AAC.3